MIKVHWYFIVLIILAFLCALFFIPVTLSFGFDGKPDIKLYYGFIRVFRMKDSDGKKKKPKKEKKEKIKLKKKEKRRRRRRRRRKRSKKRRILK